ncbi:Uncharacterized protein A9P81_2057 [Leptospira interrogans serovar Copenhageni/Icterohaemorrhagiae]|nr:Uncharacterized protein A9P81_2057 [Leptospira interrogans serovar Copenhageni/Icterohaemorrhagiae]
MVLFFKNYLMRFVIKPEKFIHMGQFVAKLETHVILLKISKEYHANF